MSLSKKHTTACLILHSSHANKNVIADDTSSQFKSRIDEIEKFISTNKSNDLNSELQNHDAALKSQNDTIQSHDDMLKAHDSALKSQNDNLHTHDEALQSQGNILKSYDNIFDTFKNKLNTVDDTLNKQSATIDSHGKQMLCIKPITNATLWHDQSTSGSSNKFFNIIYDADQVYGLEVIQQAIPFTTAGENSSSTVTDKFQQSFLYSTTSGTTTFSMLYASTIYSCTGHFSLNGNIIGPSSIDFSIKACDATSASGNITKINNIIFTIPNLSLKTGTNTLSFGVSDKGKGCFIDNNLISGYDQLITKMWFTG